MSVIPNTGASVVATVDSTEEDFALALVVGQIYLLVSTTDCWIKQGAAPLAASAAAGSMFVPAKCPVILSGKYGAAVSIIRDTADGKASLTPCGL